MKTASVSFLWALLFQIFVAETAFAFVPPSNFQKQQDFPPVASPSTSLTSNKMKYPTSVRNQRFSVARVQTMGLFGLGLPEIAVILAVGAFILGPEKLGNIAGQVKGAADGGIPEEYKKIPEEFKKGVAEGEVNAKARNAKQMDPVKDDEDGQS